MILSMFTAHYIIEAVVESNFVNDSLRCAQVLQRDALDLSLDQGHTMHS